MRLFLEYPAIYEDFSKVYEELILKPILAINETNLCSSRQPRINGEGNTANDVLTNSEPVQLYSQPQTSTPVIQYQGDCADVKEVVEYQNQLLPPVEMKNTLTFQNTSRGIPSVDDPSPQFVHAFEQESGFKDPLPEYGHRPSLQQSQSEIDVRLTEYIPDKLCNQEQENSSHDNDTLSDPESGDTSDSSSVSEGMHQKFINWPYCPVKDCLLRGIPFSDYSLFRQHCFKEHTQKGYPKLCLDIESSRELSQVLSHYKCKSCGKILSRRDSLSRHFEIVHKRPDSKYNMKIQKENERLMRNRKRQEQIMKRKMVDSSKGFSSPF